jgi:hypothetical protein
MGIVGVVGIARVSGVVGVIIRHGRIVERLGLGARIYVGVEVECVMKFHAVCEIKVLGVSTLMEEVRVEIHIIIIRALVSSPSFVNNTFNNEVPESLI